MAVWAGFNDGSPQSLGGSERFVLLVAVEGSLHGAEFDPLISLVHILKALPWELAGKNREEGPFIPRGGIARGEDSDSPGDALR